MGFLNKLRLIEERLEKIKQVNENITVNKKFSSLESDLVKEHLRVLYDLYNELATVKEEGTAEEKKEATVISPKEEKVVETPIIEVKEPVIIETEPLKEIVVEEKDTIETELPEEFKEEESVIQEQVIEVASSTVQSAEETIVSDVSKEISLFEKYQNNSNKVEVNRKRNQTKPLKQLVSLNDKFILIKELFGNNASQYEEVLAKIDSLDSKGSALDYFQTNVFNTPELREKEEVIERVASILDLKFGD